MANNPEKYLIIIRGVPGAGKSTAAEAIKQMINSIAVPYDTHRRIVAKSFEADEYWHRPDNVYDFNAALLANSHAYCEGRVCEFLRGRDTNTKIAIVSNTTIKEQALNKYLDIAEEYSALSIIAKAEGDFESIHGVPEKTVERMRRNYFPHPAELSLDELFKRVQFIINRVVYS